MVYSDFFWPQGTDLSLKVSLRFHRRIDAADRGTRGYHPNIIYQDKSLERVLAMVAAKRFVSIATEAFQGVAWRGLA